MNKETPELPKEVIEKIEAMAMGSVTSETLKHVPFKAHIAVTKDLQDIERDRLTRGASILLEHLQQQQPVVAYLVKWPDGDDILLTVAVWEGFKERFGPKFQEQVNIQPLYLLPPLSGKSEKANSCPYCKSKAVLMFSSDDDYCKDCKKYWPAGSEKQIINSNQKPPLRPLSEITDEDFLECARMCKVQTEGLIIERGKNAGGFWGIWLQSVNGDFKHCEFRMAQKAYIALSGGFHPSPIYAYQVRDYLVNMGYKIDSSV